MKKRVKFGGRKKFDEGGSVLRSTDGELVRFGYEDDDEYQTRVNADKAAQGRKKDVEFSGRTTTREAVEKAIDDTDAYNAGLKIDQRPPAPAPALAPAKPAPSKTYSEYDAAEEPGSAGFSRTPLKNKPKPVQRKTEESKPPAGAFRGTRSEGANTLPSAFRGAGARGTGTNLLSPEAKMRDINRKKRESASRDFNRLKDDAGLNFAKGGKVGSVSKRADGIATRGKTRGRYI